MREVGGEMRRKGERWEEEQALKEVGGWRSATH
jgi:hypothetical protein